jgi:hypothetical protein
MDAYQGVEATVSTDLLSRATTGAAMGWNQLGTLPTTGLVFRETDIFHNPDDGYIYCFNTEGDGNAPQWVSASISSWTASGGQATITTATPHGIPANGKTRGIAKSTGATASSGSVGNLNSAFGLVCYAPTTTTLVAVSLSNNSAITANGSGGAAGQMDPVINMQVGLRRATGPTALTTLASELGSNYVTRVARLIYYPTVVYISGSPPTWYLFGFTTGGATGRCSFTGTWPSSVLSFGSVTTVTSLAGLGDHHIRRNPADNYWYCVGNFGGFTDIRVYKSASNTDITSGDWTLLGSVFEDIGVPAWASYAIPDPNLIFEGGRVWMTFAGRDLDVNPNSAGIVELNASTFRAMGTAVVLQAGDEYESWQDDHVLSDINYLPGGASDGMDRLVGFTSDLTFSGTETGVWGALNLGPWRGRARVWDKGVGRAMIHDKGVGSAKLSDRGN